MTSILQGYLISWKAKYILALIRSSSNLMSKTCNRQVVLDMKVVGYTAQYIQLDDYIDKNVTHLLMDFDSLVTGD